MQNNWSTEENTQSQSSTNSFRYDTYLELQSTAPVCPLTSPGRSTKHTGITVARSAKKWYNKKKGKKGAQVKPGQYYIYIFYWISKNIRKLNRVVEYVLWRAHFVESQVIADMSSILATITIIIMRTLKF